MQFDVAGLLLFAITEISGFISHGRLLQASDSFCRSRVSRVIQLTTKLGDPIGLLEAISGVWGLYTS